VVTNTLNSVFLLLYVHYLNQKCLACWPGLIRLALKDWGAMIRLSAAAVAIVKSEWIAFDILAVSASYISTNSLAAYSIASTTMSILYQVPLSTSISAGLRIGELVGLGRVDILPKAIKTHFAIGAMAGLVNGVLALTLASMIPTFFTSNLEVQHIATNAFVVVGLVVLFDATTAMTNGTLRGIGRQRVGCWVSLLGYYLLIIPVSLFLTFGQGDKIIIINYNFILIIIKPTII
jgi:MATE family multidrug resistance protein